MIHWRVCVEAKRVSCLHIDRGGICALESTDVANQIFRGQARYGRVVVVVLAEMLVDRELLAGEEKLVEDVMSRNIGNAQRESEKTTEDLHRGDSALYRAIGGNYERSMGVSLFPFLFLTYSLAFFLFFFMYAKV